MIYCKLCELSKYSSYSSNLRKAIEFILSNDLRKLPMGKTFIENDKIYLNKTNIEPKNADLQKYEVHYKYIDIQIDIEGDEFIYIKNNESKCIHEYDSSEDYALYSYSKEDVSLSLDKERCLVIFPYEIHMPCIKKNTQSVIKCVVKVLNE